MSSETNASYEPEWLPCPEVHPNARMHREHHLVLCLDEDKIVCVGVYSPVEKKLKELNQFQLQMIQKMGIEERVG